MEKYDVSDRCKLHYTALFNAIKNAGVKINIIDDSAQWMSASEENKFAVTIEEFKLAGMPLSEEQISKAREHIDSK